MADTDKKRALTTRIIWLLTGIFFILMVVSQIVIYFNHPIRTEVATLYTTTETIGFKGVYVRDETLVSYPVKGVINYTHSDGSKIAKNSVIAEVYANRNDIAIQQEIDDLTAQRAVLVDAEALVGTDTSQLESFSSQISEKHSLLMQHIFEEDYRAASKLKSEMLNLRSKRDIVKGTETSFDDKIREIDSRITELRRKITSEPYEISLGEAGYFVSTVDGYEKELNSLNVMELSKERINQIILDETEYENPSGVIGKLISGYNWYMAAVLDTVRLGTIFEGAVVTLRIGASQQNVKAEIISLKRQPDGSSVAIFECDMFLADFIDSRVAQCKLLMEDYTGIRIPTDAIRVESIDGVEKVGVYILDGIVVKFMEIKQIISEEDYTLVEDTTDLNGYISLYDTVIVEGKDLYDGKIIG